MTVDVPESSAGRGFYAERRMLEDVAVAVLSGELDIGGIEHLRGVLDPIVADGRSTLIDMEALRFIDSSGLAVIVRAWTALKAQGQVLLIVAPNRVVRRVLTITGLDGYIGIYETTADALEAFVDQ